jgi:hypothetical protein
MPLWTRLCEVYIQQAILAMAHLKRVAIFQIRSMRFRVFYFTHVFIPKPVPTFGRHALGEAFTRKPRGGFAKKRLASFEASQKGAGLEVGSHPGCHLNFKPRQPRAILGKV